MSDEVNKLIENSGIITHHKVIELLRTKEWNVLISPYYYDNISNSIREIDVIAEKQFSSSGFDSNHVATVQLFIECKYINKEIVFWFDDKNLDSAALKVEKDTGLEVLHNRYQADALPETFHYLSSSKVAKIYSNNSNREDVIYKAMSQCLNSKIYYDQWFDKVISPKTRTPRSGSEHFIQKLPIIICENFSNLIEVTFENGGYSHTQINDHFQLELNYVYLDKEKITAKQDYFLIDVLNFDKLDVFLDELEKEIKGALTAHSFKR